MMVQYRDIGWWYWLITTCLLGVELVGGWQAGAYLAILLCIIQVAHYFLREHYFSAFPVQVRSAYLLLLIIGLWPPLRFVHWLQLAGTIAMVGYGYCPLARIMSLMPWNREVPLTGKLLVRTFFSPPVAGNVMQCLARADSSTSNIGEAGQGLLFYANCIIVVVIGLCCIETERILGSML